MKSKITKTCVALGNFDGIHKGHDLLINKMLDIGDTKNLSTLIITFRYLNPNMKKSSKNLKNILNNKNKLVLLGKYNVDRIDTIALDESISQYSPEKFIKEILVNKYNAKYIVVGYNFKFGYKAKGDIKTLYKYKLKYNYDIKVLNPVCIEDKPISSTYIRGLISNGEIQAVNKLLMNNYFIDCGDVVIDEIKKEGSILNDQGIILPMDGLYEVNVNNRIEKLKVEKLDAKTIIKFMFDIRDLGKDDFIKFIRKI